MIVKLKKQDKQTLKDCLFDLLEYYQTLTSTKELEKKKELSSRLFKAIDIH